MKIRYLAFTEQGERLARRLAGRIGGEASRCGCPDGLQEWTQKAFAGADALVYVGAAGIAVRAVAPFVQSKTEDPAVVVVDECARFAVPILSGHLGGANALARRIARAVGAQAVITTATDANGVFAADEWARLHNCAVVNPERIKQVSGCLLSGGSVPLCSPWDFCGRPPQGIEYPGPEGGIHVTVRRSRAEGLILVPRILVLGIGCRRGIHAQTVERAFQMLMKREGLYREAVCAVASIDLKRDEPGLLEFCARHGWPLQTYSAQELEQTRGSFSGSEFVRDVTGVDNVCERSAARCSNGELLIKKTALDGVTLAVAQKPFEPDWRWTD